MSSVEVRLASGWEPSTAEEAKDSMETLLAEIDEIKLSLGNRDVNDKAGNRLSSEDYWEWKQRQRMNLSRKTSSYRWLKGWLREHMKLMALRSVGLDDDADCGDLLHTLYNFTRESILDNGIEISDDDWNLLDAIRLHLQLA